MPNASQKTVRPLLLGSLLALAFAGSAYAGTGGTSMPWNAPLQNILDNLTGPTGKTIAALMVIAGGLIWGFGRHEQGASKIGGAIVAIGLVLGAPTFIDTLGFSGAIAAGRPGSAVAVIQPPLVRSVVAQSSAGQSVPSNPPATAPSAR